MRLSNQLFQQKMKKPANLETLDTKEIFEYSGFVEFLDAGFPYYSPVGQELKRNLEQLLSSYYKEQGFTRVQIPSIQRKEFVEENGKDEEFSEEFGRVKEDFVVTATTEEYFLNLAERGLESYTQLPLRLFEIGNAVRFIKRPQGILKLREFGGAVLISFDENKTKYKTSLEKFNEGTRDLLEKLEIPFSTNKKDSGIEYFYRSGGDVENLSLAMGYKYAFSNSEKVRFRDRENSLRQPVVGTFGIGTERVLYALCDSCRDKAGFNFPEIIRPYEKAIIPINPKDPRQIELAEKIYNEVRKEKSYLDDRNNLRFKEKLDYADFLGSKEKIIIGKKEVVTNTPAIKYRIKQND